MTTLRLRRDRLTWIDTDEEIVALDEERSMYLSANPSAALLWRALVAGCTREQLVGALVDSFEVDPATAGSDVDAFLEDLGTRGLLEEEVA